MPARSLGILTAALAMTVVRPVAAAPADLNPEAVRQAIRKGVEYLQRRQSKTNGTWGDYTLNSFPGGVTALCTLALLNSGVEPEDESVAKALGYLRGLRSKQTYVVALQTMVFCRAQPQRDMLLIQGNADWLGRTQLDDGGWTYPFSQSGAMGGGRADNSNSQFALLALHEAERAGAKVGEGVWKKARAYWESQQNDDGSFGYARGVSDGTASMTCAGIASLVIVADRAAARDARADGDRLACCRPPGEKESELTRRIDRALEWLGRNFSVHHNAGAPRNAWLFYYLYGLERGGRLTARRFIGDHDWYREGAAALIGQMRRDALSDHWVGTSISETNADVATSFALLFLSKGRWPVLVSKLRHGADDDWNQHRSDVANLTHYAERHWKRDLVWQVTEISHAAVEDLAASPVLYYCGSKSPLPPGEIARKELADKLRAYLNGGGFLAAEAYCGGAAFDEGFRRLMALVFPEDDFRLKPLAKEHPIWRAQEIVAPDQLRRLEGIDFGCRTCVVYAAPEKDRVRPSLSCLWELSRTGRNQRFSPAVQAEVEGGMRLGINILAYATDQGQAIRSKDEQLAAAVRQTRPADRLARDRLRIAGLKHPGGCSAAPRALRHLMDAAVRELKVRADDEAAEISILDPSLFEHHIVFMHGRSAFRLSDAERKRLRTYLERGGMLFADAICASKPFADSFRREIEQILPKAPLRPIPVADPLLKTDYGGEDLSTVERRDPAPPQENQPLRLVKRKVAPELEGAKLGTRYAVIFSRYDISCALEKQDSVECQGYTRQDAARIGLNVLLYSMQ